MDMSVNASVKILNVTERATDIHAVIFIVSCAVWKYFCIFLKGTNADPAGSKSGYAEKKRILYLNNAKLPLFRIWSTLFDGRYKYSVTFLTWERFPLWCVESLPRRVTHKPHTAINLQALGDGRELWPKYVGTIINENNNIMQSFDVSLTVHHSIDLFHITDLMHTSFIL